MQKKKKKLKLSRALGATIPGLCISQPADSRLAYGAP